MSHVEEILIARQPIFDQRKCVFAYELLFRSGNGGSANVQDGNRATSQVITNSLLNLGFDLVTGGKRAFINFTRDLLLNQTALLLPRRQTVVEILEDVDPDEEVIEACGKLRCSNFTLALDDFVCTSGMEALLRLANIIKVDFLLTTRPQRIELVRRIKELSPGVKLLAEKVETHEEFEEALELGFDYFQGYFFSKPALMIGRALSGFKVAYVRILQAIHNPLLDFSGMENIIKADVSLTTKLLKYINVAAFPWGRRIESIKQALVLLGEDQVRKWVSLVALSELVRDKPQELAMSSAIRGRFCERLGEYFNCASCSLDRFMVGSLSLLDAMLDLPLEEAVKTVNLPAPVTGALLGEEGELRQVLDLATAFERGEWETALTIARELGVPGHLLLDIQLEAFDWTQAIFESR